MINTHIEMDLNQHISVIAAKIIDLIKNDEETILETLMIKFINKYDAHTPDQFIEGVTFLFSMGYLSINNYRVNLENV